MDTIFKIVICAFLFINFGSTEKTTEPSYSSSSETASWLVANITSSNGSMSNSTGTTMETASVTSNMQHSSEDNITQTPISIMSSPTHNTSATSPSPPPPHPSPQHSLPNATFPFSHPTTTPPGTSVSTHTSETSGGRAIDPQATFTNSNQLSSASTSTSSTPGLPGSEKVATDSDSHSETSSSADSKPISTPPSPSTHAKGHVDTPSKLNVGSDATVVHQTPPLDPLLAGLVSAFIITAVIIALLLFLKLRRRDNQPEFRRLQDLPMDDMMEETPLSMYSY